MVVRWTTKKKLKKLTSRLGFMVLALSEGPEHPIKTCKQMFYLFIFIFCNHSWEF